MDKYVVKKQVFSTAKVLAALALLSTVLSGCVTQNYENDKTPVVKNQANRDDMAATRISLGLGYLKMGNMPQAKQNLEKAKKFAPDMVQVHTAFAHYYETVGEHKLTVESYEKALSLKSDDADTLNNYGVYLCRQDQLAAAEQQFLKAIAVPSYLLVAKSYENLASCFLQKDYFGKAEAYLNKAILHSPSSASTLFQMVRLQYAMGEYQEAKKFEQRFEKVTRRFTPQSLALAFKVYSKLGQKRTAKNYGTMLVKMYPQSWEAKQYLLNELELIDADNLAKRYQLTQAEKHVSQPKKRIVKLSPKKNTANKPKTNIPLESSTQTSTKQMAVPTVVSAPVSNTPASSTASAQAINAVLSMAPVTEQLAGENIGENSTVSTKTRLVPVVEKATEKIQLSPEKAVIENEANKRVVVLSAPNKASQKPTIVASNTNSVVENAEKPAVDGAALVNDKDKVAIASALESKPTSPAKLAEDNSSQDIVPLEDREIFHVAKKPAPIVENPVEIESGLVVVDRVAPKTPKPTVVESEKTVEQAIVKAPASSVKEGESVAEADELASNKVAEAVIAKTPQVHIVGKGDTLYGISVKYNVKIKAIRRWNKLSAKKKIRINDKLFVENPTVVAQVNE
ncbi:MAG: type IV pilus biogenesis/stability protein PilW [Colwellia sp.]|nr:type IV pilus biogenesis/stability protein PilW [Colwellia sp.]MCW8863628.1 type IV pilus biogenesis/stability protein PilW [Colwellia sp.]MCW9080404.1 type IV pilus biogenesis/stability protein PilW [Colwellia sp.]